MATDKDTLRVLAIVLPIAAAALCSVAVAAICIIRQRRQKRRWRQRLESQVTAFSPMNFGIQPSALEVLRHVGQGEFGQVFKAVYEGRSVAVKTVHEGFDASKTAQFVNEANIMLLACTENHPHVISLVGVAMEAFPLRIVLEYCENGSLETLLRETAAIHPQFLDKTQKFLFSMDIARALAFLHSRLIVHGDVATRNCLVTDRWVVRLADFGLSRRLPCEGGEVGLKRSMLCPVRWVAPEVLSHRIMSEFTDVWSFGVCMWEIFSDGSVPYSNDSDDDVKRHCVEGTLKLDALSPRHCPQAAADLIHTCTNINRNARPRFSKVCQNVEVAANRSGVSMIDVRARRHPEDRGMVSPTARHNSEGDGDVSRIIDVDSPAEAGQAAARSRRTSQISLSLV